MSRRKGLNPAVTAHAALALMKLAGGSAERQGNWVAGSASFDWRVGEALIADDLVEVVKADPGGRARRIELNLRGLDLLAEHMD